MKRLVLLGLLLGAANALAAVGTIAGLYVFAPGAETFGYFGQAPLGSAYESTLDIYYDGFPWEFVVVPAVLIMLNMVLLPLAVRSRWARR